MIKVLINIKEGQVHGHYGQGQSKVHDSNQYQGQGQVHGYHGQGQIKGQVHGHHGQGQSMGKGWCSRYLLTT